MFVFMYLHNRADNKRFAALHYNYFLSKLWVSSVPFNRIKNKCTVNVLNMFLIIISQIFSTFFFGKIHDFFEVGLSICSREN